MAQPDSDIKDDSILAGAPLHQGYRTLGGVVLCQRLGRGGMGAVYRGLHLRLNIDVAVKIMAPPPGLPADQTDGFVRRFLREAQSTAAVGHENLIRIYDVNSENGIHYLIMDYVDGESAAQRLKRKGRLSEAEAVEIVLEAAHGLTEAHRKGIVHRDIKPDNIMIDRTGHVRVADLGLAKAFAGSDTDVESLLTQTAAAMGTPAFMPPEQFASARDVGPQADVWSLGVTMYQLLTGEVPWSATSVFALAKKIENDPLPDIRSRCPNLSDSLCAIVAKSLQKDPALRYRDCGEVVQALRIHIDTSRLPKTLVPEAEVCATVTPAAVVPPAQTLTRIAAALENNTGRPLCATSPGSPPPTQASPRQRRPGWFRPMARVSCLAVASTVCLIAVAVIVLDMGETTSTPVDPGIEFRRSLSKEGWAELFIEGHSVTGLAFSPDGRLLVGATGDYRAVCWDLAAGEAAQTFNDGQTASVIAKNHVAFSPNGAYIVTSCADATAAVWNVRTGEKIRTFRGHKDLVNAVAFSPDGSMVATASADKTIALWDPSSGDRLRVIRDDEFFLGVLAIAFSPDGTMLATGDTNGVLWKVSTGQKLRVCKVENGAVMDLAFSPEGTRLAIASNNNTVTLWDVATGKKQKTLDRHSSWVSSVKFSPDGRYLATGSGDKTAALWDASSGKWLRWFEGHSNQVRAVAFSPDSRLLATSSDDNTARIWLIQHR